MSKLHTMNIYILYIFLLYFVVNKERFFLKYINGDFEEKYEFTLNFQTIAGKDFYNKLKVNKTIELTFGEYYTAFGARLKLMKNTSIENRNGPPYELGELLAEGDYLYVEKSEDTTPYYYELVGNIIQLEEFNKTLGSKTFSNDLTFQFLLEEEDENNSKNSKSRNWKTVKIIKKIKALKRYRIVKRLKQFKN